MARTRAASAGRCRDGRYRVLVVSRVRRFAAVVAAAVFALSACSNTDEPEVPVVPTPAGSDGTDGTEAPETELTPSPTSTAGVPELCSDLASPGEVARIVQAPLPGETTRVFNDDFLSDSGRTGRLTCSYGVRRGSAGRPRPPRLEIAVSGYVDAATATGRIESTVDAAAASGGTVQPQGIGGRDGYFLSDNEDVSFVVADDTRTYVITLRRGVVPRRAVPVALLELARHLLE